MGVTINVNGLSLVHEKSNGISIATIPDVCKTPSPGGPVPIPYPNIARSSDLANGTKKVKADRGSMCANYGSQFSRSIGDQPGTVGGVKSGVFMKEATWITYSFTVKLEKKGACRLTDKMFHNHQNTVNMSGLLQQSLVEFMKIVCPIVCDVIKRIKAGEKLPKGKATWTQVINDELKKHVDDLAKLGARMERTAIVAATKGMAKTWGRKAITKFGRGLAGKLAVGWIPVAGQVAVGIWTAYDAVTTAVDLAKLASEAYDFLRVRPDFTLEAGGERLVGDIKLPGDEFSPGQRESFDALNKGKKTPVLNEHTCGCNKGVK